MTRNWNEQLFSYKHPKWSRQHSTSTFVEENAVQGGYRPFAEFSHMSLFSAILGRKPIEEYFVTETKALLN